MKTQRRLLCGLLLVVGAGYLVFPHLPFQDLPAHTGFLALRQRLEGSPLLSQHYQRGSLVGPYAVFLGLGHLAGAVVGARWGLRLVAALANVALPLAVLWAHRRVHGTRWWGAGLLGLVLALGFPTALGLSSFLLGQAVLLVAVAFWLEATDAVPGQRRRAEMRVALAALVAAFTHGFALLLLVFVMAVGTLWAPPRTDAPDDRRRALWTLAPGLAVLALMWWRDRGFYPALEATPLVGYAGFADKLALPFLPTLLSRLGVDVAVAVALWLLLGAALLATLKTTTIDDDPVARRRLVLARVSVVMLAVGLLAPTRIGWFGSVDLRLCSTALLLAVLALAPAAFGPGLRRLLGRAPPLLAGVMVATLLVALVLFQAEARAPAAALARVPAGSVRPDLRLSPTSRVWAARAYLHWDKLLLLDRDVLISNPWLHQGTALRPAADHLRPAAGAAAARTPAPRSGW